jgi:hypothetical protein
MNAVREIEGTEFDWFARDGDGNFAIFATAGSGPVPERVLAATSEYDKLGQSLKISGWGTPQVWTSYSRIGLFAYDWKSEEGAYVLIATPDALPSYELVTGLQSLPGFPQFPLHFPHALFVRPADVKMASN